jgi:Fe2+ or Zn2+ uptake regulation protein
MRCAARGERDRHAPALGGAYRRVRCARPGENRGEGAAAPASTPCAAPGGIRPLCRPTPPTAWAPWPAAPFLHKEPPSAAVRPPTPGDFLTESSIGSSLLHMLRDDLSAAALRLRQNGLQVTAQRLSVLAAVARRPHSTADEIEDLVRAEIGAVSRQAVYDALGTLTEKGLIRRIQPARSPARYESRVADNHHHLVCRVCGVMVDVDCAAGNAPCLQPTNTRGFVVDEAEVIYWGLCPDCQQRPQQASDVRPRSIASPRGRRRHEP